MQTILGANGTISRVLATELHGYTKKVRLVSRNPKKVYAEDELMAADLTDPAQIEKAVAGSDIVYLLVGLDYKLSVWKKHWPVIMKATIDACIRHRAKLVFFDNMYLYDSTAISHMTENAPINPPSKKGLVRKEIAAMMMHEIEAGRLKGMIVRSADFYGPKNEKSLLIELVFKNLAKGKAASWFGNPNKIHSFTYTPDAARATALLANSDDTWNQVWHLPTDPNALTGTQWVELFSREMGKKNKLSVMPNWFISVLGLFIPFMKELPEMMYQYEKDYFFDSSKFMDRFDFKITSYSEGVRKTIEAGGF